MIEALLIYYSLNPGSWVAMGIVFLSILTSWALNYSAAKVRIFGTILAAPSTRLDGLYYALLTIGIALDYHF